jgi:hypothetical protein
MQEGHVAVRRDDVDAVALHTHPILHQIDLHRRVALDQVHQNALMVGVKVLDDDKGHTTFFDRRHGGKEGFDGSQSAGRSADADDGKVGLRRNRLLGRFRSDGRRAVCRHSATLPTRHCPLPLC